MTVLTVTTSCQESLEDRCRRECTDFTQKKCPMRIDDCTVMDSMTFDSSTRTISYAYTLSGMLDDSTYLSQANPRELLLGELRNSPNLKLYKEAGYRFTYLYHSASRKGTKLFETTFSANDYK
jgi:ADP-ribose pyrophosphatase YjhB (NUDIX family)